MYGEALFLQVKSVFLLSIVKSFEIFSIVKSRRLPVHNNSMWLHVLQKRVPSG